jgi:PIN domain nuclease of toxin-antitoxin system
MNYLLDTHALLWSLFEKKQLSETATSILLNQENTIYVSLVSFWEIALKYSIGKLALSGIYPEELPGCAEKAGFEILGLTPSEVSSFYRLPRLKHKDPFDRLIIWQCITNNLCIISRDAALAEYREHGLQIAW